MPNYRAKARGFVNGFAVEPDAVFTFDGVPGSWMEPVDAPEPEAPETGARRGRAKD